MQNSLFPLSFHLFPSSFHSLPFPCPFPSLVPSLYCGTLIVYCGTLIPLLRHPYHLSTCLNSLLPGHIDARGSIFGKKSRGVTECKQVLSFESRRGMVADMRGAWLNGCNRERGFMLLICIYTLAGCILAKLGSFNLTYEKKDDSGEAQSARWNQ